LELAYVILEREHAGILGTDAARIFQEALDDFSANSLVWVSLIGRPGARRVIKLRYDMDVELPPLIRRRPSVEHVLIRARDEEVWLENVDYGDGHPRSTVGRCW